MTKYNFQLGFGRDDTTETFIEDAGHIRARVLFATLQLQNMWNQSGNTFSLVVSLLANRLKLFKNTISWSLRKSKEFLC